MEPVKRAVAEKEHRAHRINRRNSQVERMRRAPNEKECRVLKVSRRRPGNSVSRSSNNNEAARLLRPITARDTDSRKVEKREHQKKRHRRDNLVDLASGSGIRDPEPFGQVETRFLQRVRVRCQPTTTHRRRNLFGMAIVSSARPGHLELDSPEYSSTFRGLIPKFGEGGQSRLAAIAISRVHHMIH